MSRRILINLVFFLGVLFLMLYWAVNNIVTIESIERPYNLEADFARSVGIDADAEVAYLGVHYGRVSSVERIDDGVRLTLKIDRDKKIPAGSTAHLFRKSAIGEPFVDFRPPEDYDGEGGPYLEKDERVPMDRTTVPLEFSELLRSASDLISGVSPEHTASLVNELADALEGRTDSLRQLATAGDQLSRTFAENTDLLDRLATNNTRLTHVVTEHRGSLGESLTNLRELSDSLRNASGDTTLLLDRGSRLLTEAADLVAGQKGNLDCLLGNLETVIDATTTPDRLAGLATVLDLGPGAFAGVWDARDQEPDGVWVRVNLLINQENPPPQYVPPRELPEGPGVPPCRSPLRSGQDFRPASSSRPLVPAEALAVLLVAVVAGGLASGAIVRRARRSAA